MVLWPFLSCGFCPLNIFIHSFIRVIHASDPGIAHQAITITLPWFVWGKLNGLTALVVATSKRAFHNYHPKLRNCWCLKDTKTTRNLLQNTASHHRKKWGEYLGLRHVWREWACLDCILCLATMYADDVALPAFTRRTPVAQQSIDMACRRVVGLLLWAHAGAERRTEAVPLHTVRAMPINVKEETSLFWRVQYTLHDHYSLRV